MISEGNHPLQLLPVWNTIDIESKRRHVKKIKLKLKKNLFDAKKRGDIEEQKKLEFIIARLYNDK